jgi:hypothetical protein
MQDSIIVCQQEIGCIRHGWSYTPDQACQEQHQGSEQMYIDRTFFADPK